MTREDFIAANPGLRWRTITIGGAPGLWGTDASGQDFWAIVKGEHHVSGPAPWTREQIKAAKHNLAGAQPGIEFKTVAADSYARAVRRAGLTVIADANGDPRTVFRGEAA